MKNKYSYISIFVLALVLLASCSKETEETVTSGSSNKVVAAKKFEGVVFSKTNAYFSTDGSMTVPVDSNTAKAFSAKIDLTFTYDSDYDEAGYLDPKTRSKLWYWEQFYCSWLSNSTQTLFYSTKLTKTEFDSAAADQTKIGKFLSDTSVHTPTHGIFPEGSCIGGRGAVAVISKGTVWGFKNVVSGKRGLILINTASNVDIIKEN